VLPFHIKVIGATADNCQVLHDDGDFPPLLSQTVIEYVADCQFVSLSFDYYNNDTSTTVLRPFVRDHPGEPGPEETFTHPSS